MLKQTTRQPQPQSEESKSFLERVWGPTLRSHENQVVLPAGCHFHPRPHRFSEISENSLRRSDFYKDHPFRFSRSPVPLVE